MGIARNLINRIIYAWQEADEDQKEVVLDTCATILSERMLVDEFEDQQTASTLLENLARLEKVNPTEFYFISESIQAKIDRLDRTPQKKPKIPDISA